MIPRPALIPAFLEEAGALLEKIEAALQGLAGPGNTGVLQTVLRHVHTLKGSVGLLGLAPLSGLAHDLETYLGLHGPGKETSAAVREVVTLFRALLIELEMNAPQSVRLSADLLARCDELRRRLSPLPSAISRSSHHTFQCPNGNLADRVLPAASETHSRSSPDFVRVEAGKLGRFMELLEKWGEAHEALAGFAGPGEPGSPNLQRDLSWLYELGENVKRAGLALRLTTLQRSFQKIDLLVDDMSARLGKHVQLLLSGNDAEIEIAACHDFDTILLHLVRNALQHGLETPEERLASGKDPRGTLRVEAHSFDRAVSLEVADDGRGFDTKAIREQVAGRNLLRPGVSCSDAELVQLAFSPGLSTARQVTETAGRGLGLAIVHQTVKTLGGALKVNSEPGRGAAFLIHLPRSRGSASEHVFDGASATPLRFAGERGRETTSGLLNAD